MVTYLAVKMIKRADDTSEYDRYLINAIQRSAQSNWLSLHLLETDFDKSKNCDLRNVIMDMKIMINKKGHMLFLKTFWYVSNNAFEVISKKAPYKL